MGQNQTVDLVLPTDNDALFSGGSAAFYQFIERDFKGVRSTPWEGGQYGFVRDPTDTAGGVVYTRFHEGIDIRPLHRDAHGEPLDEVRAIADGKVVTLTPFRATQTMENTASLSIAGAAPVTTACTDI